MTVALVLAGPLPFCEREVYSTMRNFEPFETASDTVESLPARTSDRSNSTPRPRPGVLVDALPANARIVVTTRNSRYRFVVIDGAERRVQISGGKLFPEPIEMLLEGATTDGGTVEPGWISVGLPVTLWTGLRRITTSPVESVAFERVPSAVRAA